MALGRFKAPDILLVNGQQSINAPIDNTVTLTWSAGQSQTYGGQTITDSKYYVYKTNTNSTPLYDSPVAILDYEDDRTYVIAGPTEISEVCYYWIAIHAPAAYESATYFNTTPVVVTGVLVTQNSAVYASISNSVTVAGGNVTLSWTESEPGQNSVVSNYIVQRSPDGTTWTTIATQLARTLTVTAPTTTGTYYYYRVYAQGEWLESLSNASNVVSLLSNTPPVAPTVITNGKTYNPKPRVLISMGYDADPQSVTATGFTASRSTGIHSNEGVDLRKTANAAVGSGSVTVTVSDEYGATASASASWNYAVPTWTDTPIVAGTTLVKAVHIMELRSAYDDICDYYGLTRTVWGEDVIAGETSSALFPTHATQLQLTATRIAQYINMFDSLSTTNNVVLPAFTDPNAARAAVINELRECVTLL